MITYLIIIQARLGSSRMPGKVLETVGGIPMVKRVWMAAKYSLADKVIVAWPERYPNLDENDVLGRFQRISQEFPYKYIVRITADCPLISSDIIDEVIINHVINQLDYCSNDKDGYDVQIFPSHWLFNPDFTNKEHVINSVPNVGGDSVNTREDLERVRKICAGK